MAVTRINNNQITDASAGNVYVGINAGTKLQDYSITAGKIANSLTYGSDLTITGNLTVNGQTTTIDTVSTVIEDPVIVLASNQTGAPAVDIGFIGERGDENNIAFVWDESADEFVTAFTTDLVTNTTITVSSYANFHTNDANIGGNIVINGTTSLVGNIISAVNVTGNITGGNLTTAGITSTGSLTASTTIDATGNITGGNVNSNATFTGVTANISGNVNAGNINIETALNVPSITVSGNVLAGNLNSNAAVTGATITASGNLVGGNANITSGVYSATVDATGNITGGNLSAGSGIISTTGNINGGNVNATTGVTSTTIDATGNITGGNLTTTGITSTGSLTASTTIDATGNITGGNINTAGTVNATGNVTGGNLTTAGDVTTGTVTATGNIDGGNLTTLGITSTGSLTASTTIDATGNITGGNLSAGSGIISTTGNINGGNVNATTGVTSATVTATGNIDGANVNATTGVTSATVTATGNIDGGNLTTLGITSTGSLTASTTIDATGNITGGNLITTGTTNTGTLETVGNALIGGNLIVQGNITYINIDDLRVEDPIIILGTGPNGAPLSADDGLDRGIFMEYYTTGLGNAFVGWDNSTGNMIIANDTYFTANDVVGINAYGTLEAGNLYIQSAIADGNITGGNLTTAGQVVATGNISGGNLTTGGDVTSATVTTSGNISGGNLTTAGQVVATGNITGGNVNTAGNVTANYLIAESGIIGNITIDDLNVGNITATGFANITGNITGGNISAGSGIIYTTGNINGGNLNAVNGVTAATGYFTGNVDVFGNLNATIGVVYANSGIFYGNAVTGNNAAFAGIPGFTQLGSNVVMQFAGNVNSYSQINFQNINSGNLASTDYIATADNGDDSTYYVNMGINSSTFDDPVDYPGFFPNDAYIHNHGGNLILNPETAGKTIQLMVGGTDTTDIIGTVSTTGFAVTGTISGTGNVSGGNLTTLGNVVINDPALTVLWSNGQINTSGPVISTGDVTGGNVTATSNVSGANIVGTTSVTGGNIVISGDDITDTNGRVNINTAGDDVDFAVNGDTVANIFFIDAGTGTASFGTSAQTTNSIVSFNTSTSILMPVGNTQQRPGTGVTGMIRFNSTTNSVEVYDNSAWTAVGVPVFTVIDDQQFNGDGSTVAFTINSNQTTNSCIVSINGVVQIPVIAYSVSGTTLTFTEAPESGDLIDVRQLTTTTSVVSISNSSGNAIVQVGDTSANVEVTGDLVVSGSVSASSFIGLDATKIANGTSEMAVVASGGNIRANIGGASIITITSGGIENSQANGVGNIGSASSYFNTVFAQATSAQYADLAEKYVADAEYAPGTVVVFGGDKEVTVSSTDADRAVAGVVSTNPSYIMNGGLTAEFVSTVALTGRVPCRVTGTVRKGDLMVSAGYGVARAEQDPRVGTVIGKALENFEGNEGVIEVVVGRF